MDNQEIKEELESLLKDLENKKKEIQDYLLEIDNKIDMITSKLTKLNLEKDKTVINTNKKSLIVKKDVCRWNHVKNQHEYDSDDPDDRLYLMDLPKLFGIE